MLGFLKEREAYSSVNRMLIFMMGGYGIFGPGNFMGKEYPCGAGYAVAQAFTFASCCVNTWEYAKEHNCDVFLNPHPHLCNMYELAEEKKRKPGEPNAFVIGKDGVRQWLLERFDAGHILMPEGGAGVCPFFWL